jgi:hypothetical protein
MVPSSGIVIWNSASSSSRNPLELLVGAIDLVDQQHRRLRAGWIDGAKQRPLDQEGLAVELAPRPVAVERVGRVEDAQLEQLARVVPPRRAQWPTSSPS